MIAARGRKTFLCPIFNRNFTVIYSLILTSSLILMSIDPSNVHTNFIVIRRAKYFAFRSYRIIANKVIYIPETLSSARFCDALFIRPRVSSDDDLEQKGEGSCCANVCIHRALNYNQALWRVLSVSAGSDSNTFVACVTIFSLSQSSYTSAERVQLLCKCSLVNWLG